MQEKDSHCITFSYLNHMKTLLNFFEMSLFSTYLSTSFAFKASFLYREIELIQFYSTRIRTFVNEKNISPKEGCLGL